MVALSFTARAQSAAQGPASAADAVTHLHLSAEGSVSVTPDELAASLVAEASSPSPAAAQGKVNALMQQGLQDAAAVNIEARAIGYSVQAVDLNAPVASSDGKGPQRPGWQARQVLELHAPSGDTLLDLVGKLQGEGFTISSLQWRLSSGLARKSRDAAMVAALKDLQARVAQASAALGLHVDHVQDVHVDTDGALPPRPMMMMRAAVNVPPQATQSAQEVTSEVTAEAILAP